MTLHLIIIAQVFASAGMTILTRKLALADRKLFFLIGCLTYGVVTVAGLAFSLLFGGAWPHFPTANSLPYLLAEGVAIPAAWLLQYKIIGIFGASNAVLVSILNYVATAAMGIVLLHEAVSWKFFIGAALIIVSIYLAFRVQPDRTHHFTVSPFKSGLLIAAMVALFAVGMFSEKQAISLLGVWDYSAYGWSLQFVGVLLLYALYGGHEWAHRTSSSLRGGLLLGLITSISGGLYIYALSFGTLSHTIIAASGKVALTMVLAAIFLQERNALAIRLGALILSMSGLLLLFQ